MTKEAVWILLILFFFFIFAGCAINVYSIPPKNNQCVNEALKERNYCTSNDKEETLACYDKAKKECSVRVIVIK